MNTLNKKIMASALCFVFLISILGISGAVSAVTGTTSTNHNSEITDQNGTTLAWGGGDYEFIKFGTDASFGIVWGTAAHPNSILMIVIDSRYLGVANVYDATGGEIAKKVPIRVYSVYGVKLLDMFEFNDTNGDHICNGIRVGDGLSYKDFIAHEPIYKAVSMTTAWTPSNMTKTENDTSKTYDFSLSAANLPYIPIGNSTSIANDVLTKKLTLVKFTFHLTASLVDVDGVSVPQYKVTVQKDGLLKYSVIDSQRMDNLTYSGKRGSYLVKWDHEIDGWSFDSHNVNKSLLLEWNGLAAYYIPEKVGEWLTAQFMTKTGADGQASYIDQNGQTTTATSSDNTILPPKKLAPGKYLEFGGNWTKVGRVTWTSDCTVDGQPSTMYAQIQGGKPFSVTGENGNTLVGLAVLGGFSYPGGSSIIHDPGIDGTVLIDASPSSHFGLGLIVLVGLFIAVVVIIAVALVLRNGKKKEGFEETYDRKEKSRNEENWSEYYERK